MKKSSLLKAVGMVSGLCLVAPTYATIVDIETSVGTIQVNLFDESTPKTVENFLAYVADDSFIDTIIHRSEPNFVVQGGGFKYSGTAFNLNPIETKGTVENEPVWSNVAGTIAMAKVAGNPDSATSQWFFNVSDNSANLDFQNEGFTAFGQVVSGMDIVEEINGLTLCSSAPMVNYTGDQCSSGDAPGFENFVSIVSITIVDDATNTEDSVEKVPTTNTGEPTPPPTTPTNPDTGSSSGGTMSFAMLGLLGLMRLFRTTK